MRRKVERIRVPERTGCGEALNGLKEGLASACPGLGGRAAGDPGELLNEPLTS